MYYKYSFMYHNVYIDISSSCLKAVVKWTTIETDDSYLGEGDI